MTKKGNFFFSGHIEIDGFLLSLSSGFHYKGGLFCRMYLRLYISFMAQTNKLKNKGELLFYCLNGEEKVLIYQVNEVIFHPYLTAEIKKEVVK